MLKSSDLLIIILAFFIGFYVVSKLIDFLKKKPRSPNNNRVNENFDVRNDSKISDDMTLSILTLIGKFDTGPIDDLVDRKIQIIQDFFSRNLTLKYIPKDQIIKEIFFSRNSDIPLEIILNKIKLLKPGDLNLFRNIVKLLLDISLTKNSLSADDELTLLRITIELNISNDNPFKRYKENSYPGNSSSEYTFQFKKDKYYGEILGLTGKISRSDITNKYRELALKYHPDKVNHLGEEFQLLAEVKIKEINSAYQYFKKKYNF